MNDRTALIISCSREQAAAIHERAEAERRTVSSYVLRILMRWLAHEQQLIPQKYYLPLPANQPVRPSAKRTTMLIRCSTEESQSIRAGAKRRCTTISRYVLHALAVSW